MNNHWKLIYSKHTVASTNWKPGLKLTETNNLLSSPATSIDRIEILYNKFDIILVSPKDKSEFIKNLTAINSNIEVKLKGEK